MVDSIGYFRGYRATTLTVYPSVKLVSHGLLLLEVNLSQGYYFSGIMPEGVPLFKCTIFKILDFRGFTFVWDRRRVTAS